LSTDNDTPKRREPSGKDLGPKKVFPGPRRTGTGRQSVNRAERSNLFERDLRSWRQAKPIQAALKRLETRSRRALESIVWLFAAFGRPEQGLESAEIMTAEPKDSEEDVRF